MSDIVKKIAAISKTVLKMYYDEGDNQRREDLKKRYDILSAQLAEAVSLQFKKNDKEYKEVMKNLKKTNKDLKELKKIIDKGPENFALFIGLLENIDTLLSAFFPKWSHNQ